MAAVMAQTMSGLKFELGNLHKRGPMNREGRYLTTLAGATIELQRLYEMTERVGSLRRSVTEILRTEPVLTSLDPPQISHGLAQG